MKKFFASFLAIVLIFSACMIPSLADFVEYKTATINVIHCGYNRDWEPEPGMPLAVVEIETSGSELHWAWTAIRIVSLYGDKWTEKWDSNKGYTSYAKCSVTAYGYPSDLETDYCAFK